MNSDLGGNVGSDVDENVSNNQRRNSFRHTPHQIEQLEEFFKSFPHPSANQRKELSEKLELTANQIKFWFQNRRTLIKAETQKATSETLKVENQKLERENFALNEVLTNSLCPSCDGSVVTDQSHQCDIRKLRTENVKLKQQLEQMSRTLENILGKGNLEIEPVLLPMKTGSFCYLLNFDSEYSDISTPAYRISAGRDEQRLMFEIAFKAMDELLLLLRHDEPIWVKTTDGRCVIHEDFYNNSCEIYNPVKSITSHTESSKYSGLVAMSAPQLLEMFMDSNKWVELFPALVTKAITIEVLDTSMLGDQAGSMQLMYEKMHTLSPLVSPREYYVIRYCRQVDPTLFVMVDVSYNSFGWNFEPSNIKCWRKPSGCMIKVRSDGYSEVTWMEHVEVDDKSPTLCLFQELIQSCSAYGAQRWILTLQRMIERFACSTMISSPNYAIEGGMTPQGRAILMNTTQGMIKAFWKYLSKCEKLDFTSLMDMQNNAIRVSFRPCNVSGGTVVSASSTLWLSVSHTAIFDYLNDEKSRVQWDIFTDANSIKAYVDISCGTYPGNRVSILQPSSLSDNNGFIIQEGCNDPLGSHIVYAPVPVQWLKSMTSGEGSILPVLPVGFIISDGGHLDHHPDLGSSSSSSGVLGGSVLTMFFQMFADPITKPEDTMKAVADIKHIITSTMFNIRSALYAKA